MKRILLILPLIFLSACVKRVTVNTFADKKALPNGFSKGSSFSVTTRNQNNPLFSKEVSEKITSLLNKNDFVVKDHGSSDYSLLFDFGMTSSKEIVDDLVYIPGDTYTTHGNVYGSRGGWANYSQTTQSYGKTISVPRERIVFTKNLAMDIYAKSINKNSTDKELVWHGSAVSCGTTGDLRYIMDYLLKALMPRLGKDTTTCITENYI